MTKSFTDNMNSWWTHILCVIQWGLSRRYLATYYEKQRQLLKKYKIQGILHTEQWHLSPFQSRHLGTSHSSPNCPQQPHCIILNLIRQSEIFSLSKMILILVKARSFRVPNLGCRGAEPPEWFDVSPKKSARDMIHEWTHCCDEAANH